MGIVADIFKAIANAIRAVIKAIGDAIKWIGTKLLPAIAKILAGATIAFAVLYVVAPAAVTVIVSTLGNLITSIGGALVKTVAGVFNTVVNLTKVITASIKSFLNVIHFKELLKLHKVMMILNKEYRETMLKVYKEVSEFSAQVFGKAEMLHLLLQGTRTLIYSLTSSVGLPFDVAEIEYVQHLDDLLQKISAKAEEYKDNPELVLDDIAEWSYTPLADKYSQINLFITDTVFAIADGVQASAEAIFTIKDEVKEVTSYLPSPIRGKVEDVVKPLTDRIDTWQVNVYQPNMKRLDAVLGLHERTQSENKSKLAELASKIVNPAKLLRSIELLPEQQRLTQEIEIEDISTKPLQRQTEELVEAISVEDARHQRVEELLKKEVPTPEILTYEVETPAKVKLKASGKRQSPFVGDY